MGQVVLPTSLRSMRESNGFFPFLSGEDLYLEMELIYIFRCSTDISSWVAGCGPCRG